MATQLFAKIKKSSKFYHQNAWAKAQGRFPFPVEVQQDALGYVIKGGPGGQYRVRDVNLFAIVKDQRGGTVEIKLS
ncbi:hypothetical protein [Methylobacterium radiotolerans]|uniref:Conserved hypothetical bacteriophage protein n=1 Tax=Methylobacterium radiotolerans (strain ATCC 27329 / DSM 1819 / JCM 2831 / NBRC 15690 / NCIMB 10815 / 0-1) TaxID=426355 RepID=B1M9Q9_METRJ|nr:hypothetical protein [Methylobacterium radiotolerans]ACB28234.1 conserved hypothetical bacteriophage protein [Methylobacterium radiotolerans JCM 2831]GEN01762.1 hypothetical protein MRA01_63010 [Methylobacterium radiotolerans]